MKKLIVALLLVLLAVPAYAANEVWAVCSPQANVTHYIVTLDAQVPVSVPYLEQAGDVMLLNVTTVADGAHSMTITPYNGVWPGPTTPFGFPKSSPGGITGVQLKIK